jgi:hypothetical protein
MQAGRPVAAHRGEEREPHAELLQQAAARLGEVGRGSGELAPASQASGAAHSGLSGSASSHWKDPGAPALRGVPR